MASVGRLGDPGSGDGFVLAADGRPRWGRYGAAGLLVRHVDATTGSTSFFVALRSVHTHMGGTWGIPGGALNRDETPAEAALREFQEEIGLPLAADRVVEIYEDDHGGWTYWTVLLDIDEPFPLPSTTNWETADVRWVDQSELGDLALLGPFRAMMARLGFLEP